MRLKRLRIRNFMSIEDLTLYFKPNTAYGIMGLNDIGKSAIIEAVDVLFNNVASIHVKTLVRDFADSFSIEGEAWEGFTVELVRGVENYYKLTRADGSTETFYKISSPNIVPPEINKLFNMYVDAKIGEKLNIRHTRDKLIMVDTTDGENYAIFQKALKTEEIMLAIRKANSIENDLKIDIETTQYMIKDYESKSDEIPDYTELVAELKGYEVVIDDLNSHLRKVSNLLELERELAILDKLELPREIEEFDKQSIVNQLKAVKLASDIIRLEKELKEIEVFNSTVESLLTEIEGVKKIAEQLRTIEKTKKLNSTIFTLEKEITLLDEFLSDVSELVEEIKPYNFTCATLKLVLENKRVAKELIQSVREEKQILNEVEQAKKEMDSFMRESKFCPIVLKNNSCPLSAV